MGRKHTAWTTFRQTGKSSAPRTEAPEVPNVTGRPAFKATARNIEKWVIEECVFCHKDFDEGQVIVEVDGYLAHAGCV